MAFSEKGFVLKDVEGGAVGGAPAVADHDGALTQIDNHVQDGMSGGSRQNPDKA